MYLSNAKHMLIELRTSKLLPMVLTGFKYKLPGNFCLKQNWKTQNLTELCL